MTLLNIANFVSHSEVDGPDVRAVIWVQGCPIHCPGCFNPDTLPFVPKHQVEAYNLAARILAIPDIAGVTFSGGEPFCQPQGLSEIARQIHAAGLTVVSFSGYTLSQLQTEVPGAPALLAEVDLLIAGPYRREQAGDYLWRGSANKQLHYLTGRLQPEAVIPPRIQINLAADGKSAILHGFPSEQVRRAIRQGFEV